MGQRTDTSKKFRVKQLLAEESFDFNNQDFEQAVIHNTGEVAVNLVDSEDEAFVLPAGAVFTITQMPAKAISGLTIEVPVDGTCQIGYIQ